MKEVNVRQGNKVQKVNSAVKCVQNVNFQIMFSLLISSIGMFLLTSKVRISRQENFEFLREKLSLLYFVKLFPSVGDP
jgi:hypothetical protein